MGTSKKLCFAAVFAAAFLFQITASRAESNSDFLARWHFIGGENLAKTTNAAKLKQVSALPATQQLRDEALRKISVALGPKKGATNESAALVRPLLDDLLSAESLMDLRRGKDGNELALTIQLKNERAKIWSENLAKLFGGKTEPIKTSGLNGWQINRKQFPNFVSFAQSKDWVVFSFGKNDSLQKQALEALKKSGRPENLKSGNWLEADVDWPKLKDSIALTNLPLKLARTEISISPKDDSLRTQIRAIYPEKLNWRAEKWNIPKQLIHDPVISFTAGQNIEVFLKEPANFRQLGVSPFSQQMFLWAQSSSPFHSFMALPQKNASNELRQLATKIPNTFNGQLQQENWGTIRWDTNRHQILWQGLPMIVPFLQATNDFLFGGTFPPLPTTNTPPPEMFAQVTSRKNLVYYDWEITQERLNQWQILSKILPPFSAVRTGSPGNSAGLPTPPPVARPNLNSAGGTNKLTRLPARLLAERWIAGIAPMLGNTATEITVSGPNELTFVRRSHIGFTGFELIMLSRWLADPNFPSLGNVSSAPTKTGSPQK